MGLAGTHLCSSSTYTGNKLKCLIKEPLVALMCRWQQFRSVDGMDQGGTYRFKAQHWLATTTLGLES